ncbi:unnamed protein product, partial [Heterotrigona itama]
MPKFIPLRLWKYVFKSHDAFKTDAQMWLSAVFTTSALESRNHCREYFNMNHHAVYFENVLLYLYFNKLVLQNSKVIPLPVYSP